jgi:hypothetical protein
MEELYPRMKIITSKPLSLLLARAVLIVTTDLFGTFGNSVAKTKVRI